MPMIQEKEHKFCAFAKLQLKESKEDFHVSGFVATSHPDRAASEDGRFSGDIIPKGTLQKIVNDINNKYKPQAGAVSERHDHLKANDIDLPVAGVLTPGSTASLRQLPDGEWGAHVDTILSKTNPRYEEVKTNIEQGVYPGFSIEYDNTKFTPTEKEGKMYRLLTDFDTEGFGYAHRRKIANPHAEYTDFGFKEISGINTIQVKKQTGEPKMTDEKTKKEIKEDKPEDVPADKPEDKPEDKPAETPKEEKTEEKELVSKEDFALLTKFKEQKIKEAKVKEITESKEFKEKLDARIKEVKAQSAPVFNTNDEGKKEFKELDSYSLKLTSMKEVDNEMGKEGFRFSKAKENLQDVTIAQQFKEAGAFADSLMEKGINVYKNWKEQEPMSGPIDLVPEPKRNLGLRSAFKEVNGRVEAKELFRLQDIEMKAGGGLGVTNATNANLNLADASWTYGSYFLSPVELNDIFQPVLVNQLNDQTTTFGRLQKEDWSGRSQIQFRARTGQNSTVGGYEEGTNYTYGTSFTGKVGRKKFQQPFAYYKVLLAITGQAQRLAQAPGGMGDVWADEIKWAGVDLMSLQGTAGTAATGLNRAVIGTGVGTQEDISLGFEGLILGTTGTLYGKALSAEPTLRSHKENMNSVRVKLKQLRDMIRLVSVGDGTDSSQIHSNSKVGDLVFFCHHLQRDFIKGLIQDMQRLVPTSARVGFEGEVEFDGVPFLADRQINEDDIFLINTANTKIAMNLPPTLEPLPVTADAQAAMIKTYWNMYSDAPGNNYFAHTFATS